ncbi:C4-dicarboxylate ABC transporter substrate-binding protein [Bradyrhizobium sp. WBAH42]|nr:C4-dicarboxylate ABC transporter substrate-binding protein [Bradyrhizobium sp. WBAH30]MDD1542075.1 C4-dicarboxylate ABC transporter substrate-binding protein [Bradyrhizobium sp. WBAH41]MDD1555059.1 C4-dicarboxylate ABC transporter substrate-binding protein [Bradyrhizobium sp. WBAH23]MDD1563890.1 C4-dicarboxylate ABC transporter substrate-binding protein [Bradyrhizobium sp. WBAH33]MDD1587484.1 C4-dicarboxylate ABC transporter substrate-binding protein [Bradyrhizobium sp. WBAH42]NRB87544.1 C4
MDGAKLPIWLRIVVVLALALLAAGASLFAYRWYVQPVTLSIAVGSLDGDAPKIVSALASRLVLNNAPVRLKVVETTGPIESAEAFSSGKTDLAVVRGDVGDLSQAQAIVVLAEAVALLFAPPGSTIKDMAGLKRTTIGVVAGETNEKIVSVLTKAYDLDRANVAFKSVALDQVRRTLDTKEIRAVLLVAPLSEKYVSLVRGLFPQTPKSAPVLIPIENAGAIAEKERAYESFDIPRGTLRGSPPVPEDDVTTLKASFYIVGKKSLDNDMIADFTQAIARARRDVLAELPVLAQFKAPDTDAGAYLPVHPGAAEFYNGSQLTFLDKWSNAIFLAPMALGALATILAAAWQFLRSGDLKPREPALDLLYALGRRIRHAENEANLLEIETEIDQVLSAQRARADADVSTLDTATLNVAAHRLENLIQDRRAALGARPPGEAHNAKRAALGPVSKDS